MYGTGQALGPPQRRALPHVGIETEYLVIVTDKPVSLLWDMPGGTGDVAKVQALAAQHGLRPGSINPNTFQDQIYKYGSLGNPDLGVRKQALDHILDSIEIGTRLGSRDVSLWFADGSNYPGTQNIRQRRQWFAEALQAAHARLAKNVLGPDVFGYAQRLLVEHKPFEPAFYHTDIADWGMALWHAQAAGPSAKVLVDTGHHYQGQNIEQIVAWLLDLDMLGGFHFNDRRYADDDLTLGSIDPYQIFRIFHEILFFEWESSKRADIADMIESEPQPERQDTGHDPDSDVRAGTVREGGSGRS
jgi:L-rhamnose isomerase / sugar isomerase